MWKAQITTEVPKNNDNIIYKEKIALRIVQRHLFLKGTDSMLTRFRITSFIKYVSNILDEFDKINNTHLNLAVSLHLIWSFCCETNIHCCSISTLTYRALTVKDAN